jgi:hypothetical protein
MFKRLRTRYKKRNGQFAITAQFQPPSQDSAHTSLQRAEKCAPDSVANNLPQSRL